MKYIKSTDAEIPIEEDAERWDGLGFRNSGYAGTAARGGGQRISFAR